MALACLFTSFAHQIHQVFLSYGLFLGAGIGLARESSNLMVGQYFKRRRDAVDIVVQTGSGIGTALFSVFFREAIGSVGWRLGLQAVTGVLFLAFVLGMCYRSASLYHPQRRAILHLKNQKRKVKDKNRAEDKPSYFDFTTVKTRTLQILMLSTAISALGIYTPIVYLALHCKQEGLESSAILLLQTFIGFAFAVGTVGFGLIVVRQNDQCMIARQYLCQASLFGLGTAILALGTVQGYHGYVLFSWIYGIFLGGYHYSLKVYTYEKARARYFARAWGFVQWSQSLPVLFGVPITGYINQGNNSRTGFYFASTFTFVGASTLFLMNVHRKHQQRDRRERTVTFSTVEGHIPYASSDNGDACACQEMLVTGDREQMDQERAPNLERMGKSISFATSVDALDPNPSEYLGCISEEGLPDNYVFDGDLYAECITSCNKVENYLIFSEFENNINTTASDSEAASSGPIPVEETLARPIGEALRTTAAVPDHVEPPRNLKRARRSITVVEEMTTSV